MDSDIPMKSIARYFEMPLVKAMLTTLLLLLVYALLPPSFFETNDDSYFRFMFSGEYITSKATPYVVNINYLLSLTYVCLYRMAANIEWYGLSQLLFVFLGVFYLLYVSYWRSNSLYSFVFISVLFCFLIPPFLISLQFTKTAFLLSFAGLGGLLVLPEVDRRARFFGLLCPGLLLLSLGFMLRRESFYLATVMVFLLIAYRFFYSFRFDKKVFKNYFFIWGMASFSICFLLVFDNFAYKGAWHEFRDFYEKVAILNNYDIDYHGNLEPFSTAGLSKNDFNFMKNWGYIDSEKYSDEKLGILVGNIELKPDVYRAVKNIINVDVRNYVFLSVLMSVAVLLSGRTTWRDLALVVAGGLILIFYLTSQGRIPSRLTSCLFIGMPFLLLLTTRIRHVSFFKSSLVVVLVMLSFYPSLKLVENYQSANKANSIYRSGMEYSSVFFKASGQQLVVWDGLFPFIAVKPFSRERYFSGDVIWLSAMNQNPAQKEVLQKQELTDFWADLLDNNSALITLDVTKMQLLRTYYLENYQRQVKFIEKWPGLPYYAVKSS